MDRKTDFIWSRVMVTQMMFSAVFLSLVWNRNQDPQLTNLLAYYIHFYLKLLFSFSDFEYRKR